MRIMRLLILFQLMTLASTHVHSRELQTPEEIFGHMPELWDVMLSPNGRQISYLTMYEKNDSPILAILDLEKKSLHIALASTRDDFHIQWCQWANDTRLLCGVRGVNHDFGFPLPITRLVTVSSDGKHNKVLFASRTSRYFTQRGDIVLDWLPDEPDYVLAEIADGKGMGVARVNIRNGSMSMIEPGHEKVTHIMLDAQHKPRIRYEFIDKKLKLFYRNPGEDNWLPINEAADENINPIGFDSRDDGLLAFKRVDGRLSLVELDLNDPANEKIIYANPKAELDRYISLGKYNRLVAVGYTTDKTRFQFFDPEIAQLFKKLEITFPGKLINITGASWDKKYYLVFVSDAQDAGSYYRYNFVNQDLEKFAAARPKAKREMLGKMSQIKYPARDGTIIPGYLTLPPNLKATNLPAVILPHGGPSGRDYFGFDWLVQYLAAKGYAILQSNYRNSGGYGEAWEGEGGFKNWQQTVNDLTDGLQHLIKNGVVDPGRVCIMGWSYGGYAALMSTLEEKGKYQCVISIDAPVDPHFLVDENKNYVVYSKIKEFIGSDENVIERGSPLKRADELNVPALLFHGEDDFVVWPIHARTLGEMLKRKNDGSDYFIYKNSEHDLAHNKVRIDMLKKIGDFLAVHIGTVK